MISSSVKPAVTRVINPIARLAIRAGITANGVTVAGAIGLIASAFYFYPQEKFFLGTIVITVFVLSDLFDGSIARLSEQGPSQWGSFLDSTIDRLADAAILVSLLIPLISADDHLSYVVVVSLVSSFLISYIRAKAESFGVDCSVGIAERTERLAIVLIAVGLHGLDIPFALAIGMWILATLAVVTVIQRIHVVALALKRK